MGEEEGEAPLGGLGESFLGKETRRTRKLWEEEMLGEKEEERRQPLPEGDREPAGVIQIDHTKKGELKREKKTGEETGAVFLSERHKGLADDLATPFLGFLFFSELNESKL